MTKISISHIPPLVSIRANLPRPISSETWCEPRAQFIETRRAREFLTVHEMINGGRLELGPGSTVVGRAVDRVL